METFIVILDIFFVLRLISSSIMCVYGYKWRKGLIATTSTYIGLSLGLIAFYIFIDNNLFEVEISAILSIIIIPIIFFILAYKCIWLNHFLTGFLVANKLLFMILYRLMEADIMDADFDILMITPVIMGILVGIIISAFFTHRAVLVCIVYIGTVDLVLFISSLINKSLFLATSDISYIFDPKDLLLKIIGIDIPSALEVLFIVIVGVLSFIWQKNQLDKKGIDLSNRIVDDRKKKLL